MSLVRWDGTTWQVAEEAHEYASLQRSEDDLYVLRNGDAIERRRGHGDLAATIFPPPSTPLETFLALSDTELWAITKNTRSVLHHDGNSWQAPAFEAGDQFYSVFASGAQSVWFAGLSFHGEAPQGAVLMHWDGQALSTAVRSSQGDLARFQTHPAGFSAAATEAWLPGLGMRFSGTDWIPIGTDAALSGVWGTSSSDVWLVSHDGASVDCTRENQHGRLFHWNGVTLNPVFDSAMDLLAVHGSDDGSVWAVGCNGATVRDGGLGRDASPPP